MSDARLIPVYPMSDIADRCVEMTRAELARYYGCDASTTSLRLRNLGLTARQLTPEERSAQGYRNSQGSKLPKEPRPPKPERAPRPKRAPATKKPKAYVHTAFKAGMKHAYSPKTTADCAVDHLRRLGPIWRCNEDGTPNCGGQFFRRGSAILTEAQIIALAERKGFDANAWRRAA